MKDYQDAMLRGLVAVAWADGYFAAEESEIIEALVSTFALSEADAEKVRTFAKTPRTLDDVPLTELSADDRRLLLQHAVMLSYIDGGQSAKEQAVIRDLVGRLHIPETEATTLIDAANERAKKFLDLLDG